MFVFGMPYFISILVLQSSDKKDRAGCFAFIVLWMSCFSNVLWLFLTVPCVGLQSVIVVFPDHTHLLFFIFR